AVVLYDGAPYTDRTVAEPLLTLHGFDSVAFSPDNRWLAAAGPEHTVKVWDVATGQLHWTRGGHTWHVTAVAFHPAGQLLASASWDQTVRVWDVATGATVAELPKQTYCVMDVTFDQDGKQLAVACLDGWVKVWEWPSRRELFARRVLNWNTYRVAFSPDG